jgi:multidrug efflux pump subunit AcrA (membrane-fusion protein)
MKAIWQKIVKHNKWILIAIVVAVAVKGGLAWQASNRAKAAGNVTTAAVIRAGITSLVSATGTISR